LVHGDERGRSAETHEQESDGRDQRGGVPEREKRQEVNKSSDASNECHETAETVNSSRLLFSSFVRGVLKNASAGKFAKICSPRETHSVSSERSHLPLGHKVRTERDFKLFESSID
jgi:hypothetical protein